MLVLVLFFLLAAFSMLAVAVVTGTLEWAWLSVTVSVLATMILVADWRRKLRAIRDRNTINEPSTLGLTVTNPPTAPAATPPSPRASSHWITQQPQLADQNHRVSGGPPSPLVPNPRVASDLTGLDQAHSPAESGQPAVPEGTRSENVSSESRSRSR